MRARLFVAVIAVLAGAVVVVAVRRRRRSASPAQPTPFVPPPPEDHPPEDIPEEVLIAEPDVVFEETEIVPVRDSGELYGMHTVRAVDTTHADDDEAQANGENWLEALAGDATESGPEPERTLEFLDDDDLVHPSSDTSDRPIADRGSAGPRGV